MKRNIVANLLGKLWSMLSGFLFVPLYIKFLGFESYSVISFTLIISGIVVILDAGLTATLSREFARADNDKTEKYEIFKTLESCYLLVGLVVISLVFTLSDVISSNWVNLSTGDSSQVPFYLKVYSFDIGFQMLFRFYMGGLLGLEKQVKANVYQISLGVLRNALVVVVIMVFPTLNTFFLWQCISSIMFAVLIKLSLEKTLIDKHSFNIKCKIEKKVIAKIWRFAGGIMLISLVSALNTQMDKLAISKLLSLETLGYYTLAVSLSNVLIAIANPFSSAVLPRFTNLFSVGKKKEASELYHKIVLFLAGAIFSIYANMLFFSEQIFFVWTGNIELSTKAHFYLPYNSFSMSMLALAVIPYSVALANGYTRLNNVMGLISLFITLPGYWIATSMYGGIGAAIVFCCVQTITTVVYYYFINKKFIETTPKKTTFTKKFIGLLIIAIFTVYSIQFLPLFYGQSRMITFVLIGFSTVITFLVTLIFAFSTKEIKDFIKVNFLKPKYSSKV